MTNTAAKKHLRKADIVMREIIEKSTRDRTAPAATGKPRRIPYFHFLVDAIANQQLSQQAGRTIANRLRELQGGGYFSAAKLHKLRPQKIRQCGFSDAKVRYIKTLAGAVVNRELNFRQLANKTDQDVRLSLTRFPGIGAWSADIFMLQAMRRPDIFPVGDLILQRTINRYYKLPDNTKPQQYLALAQKWSPYRSMASRYLWSVA